MKKRILTLVLCLLLALSLLTACGDPNSFGESTGSFDEQTNICTYGMDLFQRQGDVWYRSQEEHREYAYSQEQLVGYLKEAGFTKIRVYADRSFSAPGPNEQRIYIKARKGIIK